MAAWLYAVGSGTAAPPLRFLEPWRRRRGGGSTLHSLLLELARGRGGIRTENGDPLPISGGIFPRLYIENRVSMDFVMYASPLTLPIYASKKRTVCQLRSSTRCRTSLCCHFSAMANPIKLFLLVSTVVHSPLSVLLPSHSRLHIQIFNQKPHT